MKGRLIILSIILASIIIVQYLNQHQIVRATQEYASLEKKYAAARTINNELIITYNELISRDRIVGVATEQLGMFQAKNDGINVTYVKEQSKENQILFSLIDYITPSAQALTER